MRSNIIILLVLLFSSSTYAQKSTKNSNISNFCKVWGFLKYHHPTVAKGEINWDHEFVKGIKNVNKLKEKEDISDYYIKWIEGLGKIKKCHNCQSNFKEDKFFLNNYTPSWRKDTTSFSIDLIKKLEYIRSNRNHRKNFYVGLEKPYKTLDFSNEQVYADSIFPSKEFRLLTLSRYWNIINYFYPYKYKIGVDWDTVLEKMIPIFLEAKNTVEYHTALHKMVAKINDSHSSIMEWECLRDFLGGKIPPFGTNIINDSTAIVSHIINDSLSKLNNVYYGDVIYRINNQSITERINDLTPYFSSSNEASTKFKNQGKLFLGHSDSILIRYERDGRKMEQYIKRYPFSVLAALNEPSKKKELSTQILAQYNIGYINMGTLQQEETKRVMIKMMNTQAIIFDVRNYPKGTILQIIDYLYPKPIRPMTSIFPITTAPGIYYRDLIKAIGSENKDYYKGKVIILVNEQTQSHAETTAFLLQQAPNAIVIGSQTSGADGRVTNFKLPGNVEILMTGEGIIIPDIQRNGIIPDIVIKPTIDGVRNHKDEVLEKAMELAK